MFTHIDLQIETLLILAAAWLFFQRLHHRMADTRTVSAEDDLYKMTRITGAGEYEIFQKSAEDEPVPESIVEEHFKDYLRHQATPYYVNDFVRNHKQQIDNLELLPF